MHVEAAAALAPVLARFAIVVHGPMEAEVVGRVVAGGDRAVPLGELARPLAGDPGMSRAATVALVRTVLARLVAGGTVEHVAGGYRLSDPRLAATLRGVVEAMAPRGLVAAGPEAATAVSVPLAAAVAPEEASRLLQTTIAARAASLPSPSAPPTSRSGMPGAMDALARGGPHVVVSQPSAPPAGLADRLATVVATRLTRLPVAPVRWGDGDPAAARALAPALGEVMAAGGRPVVLDRGLVPALVVLADDAATLPALVVDLRSSGAARVPVTEASTGAAGMVAGAAGVAAPTRRVLRRPVGRRGARTLLEVLFGPRFADEIAGGDGEEEGAPDRSTGHPGGVVVTSRTDDPQAEALGELLGVEVVHLSVADDLAPEVLAFLEDDEGQRLLPPSA